MAQNTPKGTDLRREADALRKRISELEEQLAEYSQSHGACEALLDHSEDCLLVSDAEGKPLAFNRAYARTIQDTLGVEMRPGLQPHTLLQDPAAIEWWNGLHRRVLGGERFRVEYAHPLSNDEVRHWEFSFSPVLKDDEVDGFTEIARDITERKQSEEALRRSDERSRALLNHTSESAFCYQYDPPIPTDLPKIRQIELLYEGTLVECNDNFARSYGFAAAADVIGRRLDDLLGVSSGRLDALFESFVDGDYRMHDGEGKEVLPDGSKRYFLNSAHGVVRDGKLRRVWGAFRDITPVKRSEIASREREALMGAILESIPFDFFALDPEGTYVLQNSHCRENWGPIIGKRPQDVAWSPEVLELWKDNNRRAMSGEIVDCEVTMDTDGDTRYFRNIVAPAREGDRTHCIFGVNIDLTLQRMAEAQVRASEERFRRFFENAPAYCYMVSPEGTIQSVNAAASKCLGYSEDELIGRHIRTIYSTESQRKVSALLERWSRVGEIRDEELEVLTKSGERRQVLLSATAIRDDSGDIQSSISVQIDITERRKANAEKTALQEQLLHAQKMEAIGTLAGGLAHDLNNTLMGVVGMASVLRMRSSPGSPEARDSEIIEKAGRSAFEMTEQLLGFARKTEPHASRVDLQKMLGRISMILRHTLPKNIEIKPPDSSQRLDVAGDAGQLEQVIMNLAVNARDAMPDGGVLGFSLEQISVSEQSALGVPGLTSGQYAVVSVSDQGCGIPKEVQSRVFEPFFTTKEAGQGTGMGLAMVYVIVRDHGGAVVFDSDPGSGTVFRVYLPRAQAPEQQAGEETSTAAVLGTGTILVVDDEETVRRVTEQMLAALGYEVLLAHSGEEALEIFSSRSRDIDLIVLDLMMPGMSGQQTLERLLEADPEARVVLASGNLPPDSKPLDMSTKSLAFIQKPYTIKVLSEVIASALDKGSGDDEK